MATPQTRFPGLDALRGGALVVVVGYHLGYLRGGFLGVDLFFVLSGFLLTGLALAEIERTDTIGLRAFWGRRVRRLGPALLVMVPVATAGALLLDWPTAERRDLALDGTATLTWWANWRQVLDPDGGYWSEVPNLFRHAWSLSVEEQFYVVWPLLLTACIALAARGRRTPRLVVGVVAGSLALLSATWALVLAHRLPDADLARVYLGSDTRALAPLVGCVMGAVWWGRSAGRVVRAFGWAAVVGLLVLVVIVDVDEPTTYRTPLLALVAVLAGLAVVGATGWSRIDPVSRWIGHRSYGLYLWSWPLQALVEHWRPSAGRAQVAAVTIPLTVLAAEVSWRFVEHPVQRHRWWATRAVVRRATASVGLVVALVATTVAVSTATEKAPHERMTDAEMADAVLAPPPEPDPGEGSTGLDDGAASSGERVMLVGDSVAFSYARYAAEIGPVDGVASIDNRGVPFCGVLSAWQVEPGVCTRVAEAIDIGLAGEPDVVLWIPGGWEWAKFALPDGMVEPYTDGMADALQERMLEITERAAEGGARTIILEWSCPGPADKSYRTSPEYLAWINGVISQTVAAGQARGLPISLGVPPAEVCTGGARGEATPAKNIAANDEVHAAGPEGAAWIWQYWLGPIIRETR